MLCQGALSLRYCSCLPLSYHRIIINVYVNSMPLVCRYGAPLNRYTHLYIPNQNLAINSKATTTSAAHWLCIWYWVSQKGYTLKSWGLFHLFVVRFSFGFCLFHYLCCLRLSRSSGHVSTDSNCDLAEVAFAFSVSFGVFCSCSYCCCCFCCCLCWAGCISPSIWFWQRGRYEPQPEKLACKRFRKHLRFSLSLSALWQYNCKESGKIARENAWKKAVRGICNCKVFSAKPYTITKWQIDKRLIIGWRVRGIPPLNCNLFNCSTCD